MHLLRFVISYKESKELLAIKINKFLDPIREKKAELDKNPKLVEKILKDGAERAAAEAEKIIKEVKKKIGVA